MTIVADEGAVDVGVGVGVGVNVAVGEGVVVGVSVSDGDGDEVGDVVSAGVAGSVAPASVREVTKPPEIAVAAVSAVIRATRRQSPVPTRRVHPETPALVRRFGQNRRRGGTAFPAYRDKGDE